MVGRFKSGWSEKTSTPSISGARLHNAASNQDHSILMAVTGEYCQPARVHNFLLLISRKALDESNQCTATLCL